MSRSFVWFSCFLVFSHPRFYSTHKYFSCGTSFRGGTNCQRIDWVSWVRSCLFCSLDSCLSISYSTPELPLPRPLAPLPPSNLYAMGYHILVLMKCLANYRRRQDAGVKKNVSCSRVLKKKKHPPPSSKPVRIWSSFMIVQPYMAMVSITMKNNHQRHKLFVRIVPPIPPPPLYVPAPRL